MPWGRLGAVLVMLATGGCATQPPAATEPQVQRLERRVQMLEQRIRKLETESSEAKAARRQPTALGAPPLEREAKVDELQKLYLERDRLLRRYTPMHPDVKLLDQEIHHIRDSLRKETKS